MPSHARTQASKSLSFVIVTDCSRLVSATDLMSYETSPYRAGELADREDFATLISMMVTNLGDFLIRTLKMKAFPILAFLHAWKA